MKYFCGIVLFVALLAFSVRPSEEACGYEVRINSDVNLEIKCDWIKEIKEQWFETFN